MTKHPLSIIRRIIAAFVLLAITLLFLDFTGALKAWFGFLAKLQLLPAILAANFVVIAAILLLTLVFGRVYCSFICPLGVFQDGVSWLSGRRNKGKKRLRFSFSKEKKWLRYSLLVLLVLALVFGVQALVALLAPYSAYGRIVNNLFSPIYRGLNNVFAWVAERANSYAFYPKSVWIKSLPTFIVATVTFVAVVVLAFKNGRSYCNTVCPVGTALGLVSRFAMFRPKIDESKCKDCGLCERGCKASCIDAKNKKIDYSRCVGCFDCLDVCSSRAISYKYSWKKDTAGSGGVSGGKAQMGCEDAAGSQANKGRRAFLASSALLAGALTIEAQEKKLDGGLAVLLNKEEPKRTTRLVPFGSGSPKRFYERCTACGLCIAACPNKVLRPSSDLQHLMMPYMSYEKGYCRPECTACSQVCPTGAILPITAEEKTAIHIGVATVNHELCVVNTDGVSCGNCARHCPAGAIHMVAKTPGDPASALIPAVDTELCTGCGACENLCPAAPFSAISVNGKDSHTDNR